MDHGCTLETTNEVNHEERIIPANTAVNTMAACLYPPSPGLYWTESSAALFGKPESYVVTAALTVTVMVASRSSYSG